MHACMATPLPAGRGAPPSCPSLLPLPLLAICILGGLLFLIPPSAIMLLALRLCLLILLYSALAPATEARVYRYRAAPGAPLLATWLHAAGGTHAARSPHCHSQRTMSNCGARAAS